MIEYHQNSKNPKAKFSILIPTWNNLPFVELCVRSIKQNSTFDHQIVLHVNDGSDGTLAWAKTQGLDYSLSANNVGICLACNAAASLATTDYILYINDDMYVCPEWDLRLFEKIADYGKNDFYFSGTMIERTPDDWNCTSTPHNYGDSPANFRETDLLRDYQTLAITDWRGANYPPSIMHRSYWDLIGGFSVEFSPGMYSDPDICRKLWEVGVRNFRGVGDSLVYHFMSKSIGRVKRNNGRAQFMHKWKMSSHTFLKHYLGLHRGGTDSTYRGLATEPANTLQFKIIKTIDKLKSLLSFI
jgi:glycosyltransferase involved in cell wall biosynthesis